VILRDAVHEYESYIGLVDEKPVVPSYATESTLQTMRKTWPAEIMNSIDNMKKGHRDV
jgi:hypothetical protein